MLRSVRGVRVQKWNTPLPQAIFRYRKVRNTAMQFRKVAYFRHANLGQNLSTDIKVLSGREDDARVSPQSFKTAPALLFRIFAANDKTSAREAKDYRTEPNAACCA
jgi:hypothetical protein